MMKSKIPPKSDQEFSIEFGDVNGAKLLDILLRSQKNHKKKTGK